MTWDFWGDFSTYFKKMIVFWLLWMWKKRFEKTLQIHKNRLLTYQSLWSKIDIINHFDAPFSYLSKIWFVDFSLKNHSSLELSIHEIWSIQLWFRKWNLFVKLTAILQFKFIWRKNAWIQFSAVCKSFYKRDYAQKFRENNSLVTF